MSNQHTYSVPFTEEELYDCYVNQQMSQAEVARKFNTTQKVVWRALHKLEIPVRKAYKRDQIGEKNSSWKGGRFLRSMQKETRFSSGGYWYVKVPDHPNAQKGGYIAEHVLVAAKHAGRPLQKGECVHHLDLNKHNNHPDNLVICTRKQHREYHLELEMIAVQLYRQGKVRFSPEQGYYLVDMVEDEA